MTYTTDHEMWWNDDRTRLVEPGDPAARFLLPAGSRFSLPDARKYGLVEEEPQEDSQPADQPAGDAATVDTDTKAADGTKAVAAPPNTKQRTQREDKGR